MLYIRLYSICENVLCIDGKEPGSFPDLKSKQHKRLQKWGIPRMFFLLTKKLLTHGHIYLCSLHEQL